MRGIVTLEARDKDTLELQGTYVQENIITESFSWLGMRSYHTVWGGLSITDAVFEPSIIAPQLPYPTAHGFYVQHRQQDVFGVPSSQVFSRTVSTPTYIQFSGRFLPPTATRMIATVMFSFTPQFNQYYGSYPNENTCRAYAKLNTPCVQTETQVYDIYYRIFFDYEVDGSDIHWMEYENILRRYGFASSIPGSDGQNYNGSGNTQIRYQHISPFPTWHIDPADRQTYTMQWPVYGNIVVQDNLPTTSGLGFGSDRSLAFDTQVGQIINGIYTTDNWGHLTGEHNFGDKFSKLQNVIAHREQLTTINAQPFLDVDNLPTGTGRVNIGGTWDDEEAHATDELYFYRKLPEWNHVELTSDGQLGEAEYKYVRHQFVGLHNWESGRHVYRQFTVFSAYGNTDPEYGMTVFGDTDDSVFSVEQLSAAIKFDDASVIIPKVDKLLLLAITTSRRYIITGGFTAAHQVAVKNGTIYIACRNTGLWQCDPRVSLTATQVTVGGYRSPDFSKCHGVTIGYNDVLWAVGEDALASFDGTTWTLYDSTTAHPFGVDNTIYPRIAYVKADPDSATNELLFVYSTLDPTTALGFWWSTATTVQDTGTQPTLANSGRPRINKSHVGGLQGRWAVRSNDRLYMSDFNGATWAQAAATSTNASDTVARAYNSVNWVKGADGTPYLFHFTGSTTIDWGSISGADIYYGGYGYYYVRQLNHQLMFADGTLHSTLNTSTAFVYGPSAESLSSAGSSTVTGYAGTADLQNSFELAPGLRFTLVKKADGGVFGMVNTYCLNRSPHGGVHNWIAFKRYGWNGSAWELNHPDSKVTHASTEPLLDGITVNFEDGTAGTSFRAPNNWRFGLCRGLFKDNATRARFKVPTYFTKTKTGLAQLTSNTVPTATSLPTGLALMDTINRSNNAAQAPGGTITFPGNNSGQFAVSSMQVTGDFEIAINVDDLKAATATGVSMVGIGKLAAMGFDASIPGRNFQPTVGVYGTSATEWRVNVRNSHVYTGTFTGTTDITIQRLGGIVTIKRNGTVVYTVNGASLPPNDQRLNLIWTTYFSWSPIQANRTAAAMTILANGSDNGIFIGNEAARTGSFALRFKGIDVFVLPIVTLDGTSVPVKTDGTLPAPGEVSIDWQKGALYFNAADVGKAVTFNGTQVFTQ